MKPPYRIDRAEVVVTELLMCIKKYKDAKTQKRDVEDEAAAPSGVFDAATRWVRKNMHSDSETKDTNVDALEITLQSLLKEIKQAQEDVDFTNMHYDAAGNDTITESKEFLERAEKLLDFKTGSPTLDGTGEGSIRARFMKADENLAKIIKATPNQRFDGYSAEMANRFNPPVSGKPSATI